MLTAPAAPSYSSPETVPAHALTFGRRVLAGYRFTSGASVVRALFRRCAQAQGRRLDAVEAARVVLLARALWRDAKPSPLGGKVIA